MNSQQTAPAAVRIGRSAASKAQTAVLPQGTPVVVSPLQEISLKHLDERKAVAFVVETAVLAGGVVVIPRGSIVEASVTKLAKGKAGVKSGTYKLSFDIVQVRGRDYALRGSHIQQARGNTIDALFGLVLVTERSAVITPGHLVNAFTAESIPYDV